MSKHIVSHTLSETKEKYLRQYNCHITQKSLQHSEQDGQPELLNSEIIIHNLYRQYLKLKNEGGKQLWVRQNLEMKEENVLHPLLRVVRCVCVCVRVRAPPGLPAVASNCLASLLRTCCLIESYTCYWQVQSAANRGQSSVWHWASSSKLNGLLCAYLRQ